MARYLVGQFRGRMVPDAEKESMMVMFRDSSNCGSPGAISYEELPEAEKEAARLSHDHGFEEFAVFQLIETVRAAEPLDTAIIKKE
jgi:hypothetical protein